MRYVQWQVGKGKRADQRRAISIICLKDVGGQQSCFVVISGRSSARPVWVCVRQGCACETAGEPHGEFPGEPG